MSLAVLANCLEAEGQPGEALAADREAIVSLAEPFLRLPTAFSHWMQWMQWMVQQHRRRCAAQACKPDDRLLKPVVAVLDGMAAQSAGEQEQGDGR